jgi:hypothetical protein
MIITWKLWCHEVTAGGQLAIKITAMETCETVVTHSQEGAF